MEAYIKYCRILLVEMPIRLPIAEQTPKAFHSTKFLNLFKAEEEAEAAAEKAALEEKTGKTDPLVGDDANTVSMQSVAQLSTENLSTQTIPLSGPHDDHTDLRLQQNHAAGLQKLGRGAE